MEFALLERQYMDAVEATTWENECREREIELQQKQTELREKQMKAWNRLWKLELIEKINPTWKDLSDLI